MLPIQYNPSDQWKILEQMADSPDFKTKYLSIDSSDKFKIIERTTWEKFKHFIGFGDTSRSKLTKTLKTLSKQLKSDAQYIENIYPERVYKVQKFIDKIFQGVSQKNSLDLFEGMNTAWMEKLPESVKKKKISQLILPGTHDSGAYKVDFKHTMPKLKYAGMISRIIPFVGKIISNWTITNKKTLSEQLEQGIRYFDFRISYNDQEKKFYLTHTFTCVPLEEALDEIKAFMDSHKGEVVVIAADPDYEHRQGMDDKEVEMMQFVQNKFGSLLCPPPQDHLAAPFDESMTLQNLVDKNQRVIFGYARRNNSHELGTLWDKSNLCLSDWLDSSDPQTSLDFEKGRFQTFSRSDPNFSKIHQVGLTITPQVQDIKDSVLNSLLFWRKNTTLETMTKSYHKLTNEKVLNDRSLYSQGAVITADFCESYWVDKIIKSNR